MLFGMHVFFSVLNFHVFLETFTGRHHNLTKVTYKISYICLIHTISDITLHSRVLSENSIGLELVKKFPA